MSLSDFLTLVNIGITLIVGFYLTHWFSVRDSRHRALKDFYINEVKSLSDDIGETFRKLKSGEITGEQFVQWFNSIERRLENLDEDIMEAFPIFLVSIYNPVFEAHMAISNSEDFNNNYRVEHHIYDAETSNLIVEHEEIIYKAIHNVVSSINECPKRGLINSAWRWFKKEWFYFIKQKQSVRGYLWHWLKRIVYYAIIFILPIIIVINLWPFFVDLFKPEEYELERRQVEAIEKYSIQTERLIQKIDSVDTDLKAIHERMGLRNRVINTYVHTNCIPNTDIERDTASHR